MRTREEWGGGARPRALTRVGEHPYIEVHHDVYPFEWSGVEHARAIEQQHLAQGWNGAFYNLGVAADGEVYELRGRGWQSIASTWHGKRYSDGTLVDKRALTVVVFGNFEVSQPSDAQLATLAELAGTVPDPRLRWHRMRDATACCGRHLIARLPTITEDDMGQLDGEQRDWLYEIYQSVRRRDYDGDGHIDTQYLMDAVVGLREQIDPRGEGTIRDALLAVRNDIVAAVRAASIDIDALAASIAAKVGAGPVNLEVSGTQLEQLVKNAVKAALREGTGA